MTAPKPTERETQKVRDKLAFGFASRNSRRPYPNDEFFDLESAVKYGWECRERRAVSELTAKDAEVSSLRSEVSSLRAEVGRLRKFVQVVNRYDRIGDVTSDEYTAALDAALEQDE